MINIIIFVINLILLFKGNNVEKEEKLSLKGIQINFKFKNSDDNFLNFSMKTFQQISNYLNKKFNNKIIKNKKKKRRKRKKITVYSVNQIDTKSNLLIIKYQLQDKFLIKFNKNKPDYLIYDVFGKEHLNKEYNNSIKIAIFSENKIPDFNEADYAISQAHINYLDRYLKYPSFLWHNIKAIKKLREKVLNNPLRTKFCAAVISNNVTTLRIKFINELNKYKKVDMGGQFLNNVGGPVKNKIEFLSSYKFSIAFENSEGDGYISEKIVDSLLSGTIPIYYGDYTIDEFINLKSFILIKNERNIKEKIEYIKEIDNNPEKYLNILKESILIYENISDITIKDKVKFLYNIFSQEKEKAKRIFS